MTAGERKRRERVGIELRGRKGERANEGEIITAVGLLLEEIKSLTFGSQIETFS
jgi:hypothetical protein